MTTGSNGITRLAALAVLGLPEHASSRDITQAFRRLAKATHPDRNGTTETATAVHPAATDNELRFAVLVDAYHALASTPQPTPPSRGSPSSRADTLGPVFVPVRVRQPPRQSPARPPIVAGPVHITPSPAPASQPRSSS